MSASTDKILERMLEKHRRRFKTKRAESRGLLLEERDYFIKVKWKMTKFRRCSKRRTEIVGSGTPDTSRARSGHGCTKATLTEVRCGASTLAKREGRVRMRIGCWETKKNVSSASRDAYRDQTSASIESSVDECGPRQPPHYRCWVFDGMAWPQLETLPAPSVTCRPPGGHLIRNTRHPFLSRLRFEQSLPFSCG